MVWDAVLLRVLGEGKLGAGSRVFEEKSEVEEQVRWLRNIVSQATPVVTANSSRARRSIALVWARELQQTARQFAGASSDAVIYLKTFSKRGHQ